MNDASAGEGPFVVHAVNQRQRRVFGNVLAFALRNFLTLTMLGVSPEFFEKITIYWFLEGAGHPEKLRAPSTKKNWTPKNGEKIIIYQMDQV